MVDPGLLVVDIPSLASAGLLHQKSTVKSLKAWLEANGVFYTAKSKKDELVGLVLDHLGDGIEQ